MLGILTSNAFIWVIIENIIIFVSKYVMNISQVIIDLDLELFFFSVYVRLAFVSL